MLGCGSALGWGVSCSLPADDRQVGPASVAGSMYGRDLKHETDFRMNEKNHRLFRCTNKIRIYLSDIRLTRGS